MIDTAGYGKALFELSAENGTDETVRGELELVREALRRQPEYVTLLDTPAVAVEESWDCCARPFRARIPCC